MDQPGEPMMRTVSASSAVSNPTPIRDGRSNITRLERSAEELSQGGSDIGEEIRKMNVRSRSTSIQSSQHEGSDGSLVKIASPVLPNTEVRSRASSHAASIVDVNGTARLGGYSPSGYISSPVGSSRSRESQLPRKISVSGSSRLAQMVEPAQEGRPLDSPLRAGFPENVHALMRQPSSASRSSVGKHNSRLSRDIESSFENIMKEEEEHQLPKQQGEEQREAEVQAHAKTLEILEGHTGGDNREGDVDAEGRRHHDTNEDMDGLPNRPQSADTFQEAALAFQDFDGTHYSPRGDEFVEVDRNGNELRQVSARKSSGRMSFGASSMLSPISQGRPMSYMSPPPGADMVYYPAPVPRMLNLPKRLSQLPAADVQSQRRSQVLSTMPMDAAPWHADATLSPTDKSRSRRESALSPRGSAFSPVRSEASGSHGEQPRTMLNERMSIANFNNLPPQLRASVYFEHMSVQQDVKVERASAVATLDSILAASATAPVNAFMDHPYAGDVRSTVYAAERIARKSTGGIPETGRDLKKRSSVGNLLRRRSASNVLDANTSPRKLQRRRSQLSLGDELERETPETEVDLSAGLIANSKNAGPDDQNDRELRSSHHESRVLNDADLIEEDFRAQEAEEDVDVDEGEARFVQPATLLAELQVRKAQQKSRNRTAVSAFPGGMHSTLLQLDAVEEINKKRRQNQRINLAWEDPSTRGQANGDEDDDVPLGMLYPGKDGAMNRKTGDARDWDRPLGLMERRQLEDNEPLSSRRNRLKGVAPRLDRRTYNDMEVAAAQAQAQQEEEQADAEDENAGESLGQRQQRLKRKSVLDSAIADVAPQEANKRGSTFTDDVMSQFGGLDVKGPQAADANDGKETPDIENETLGQRRARLQREREVSGGSAPARPALRQSNSLSNLLAANPAGPRRASARDHQPQRGTLLHASEEAQSRHKQQLYNTNVRSSSYAIDRPLVDSRPSRHWEASTGLLGGQNITMGGFAGGKFNNGAGGVGMPQQQQQPAQPYGAAPMYTVGDSNGMFTSPTATALGMGTNTSYTNAMGINPMMTMLPQQQQQWQQQWQPMVNPMAYQALNGGHMSYYGLPGMMGFAGNGAIPGNAMTYGAAAMRMAAPDEGLDNKQRDLIDRWRMGVAQ